MINFVYITKENIKMHNPNRSKIPDHSWISLDVQDLEKQNDVPNLINHQPEIDEIYLYAKDPNEPRLSYKFKLNR